jgi:hypothetical protein
MDSNSHSRAARSAPKTSSPTCAMAAAPDHALVPLNPRQRIVCSRYA